MASRPLRSLLIGDVDHYPSEFIFGVAQGMTLLGHWHSTVNIRQPIEVIAKRMAEVQPDVVWAHMLLWSPAGEVQSQQLLTLCHKQRWERGARVIIHDGDAREETRWPLDISWAVDLVLCNHTVDRSAWKIPRLRWPYFAFRQRQVASPVAEFDCALLFAGRLGAGIYQARSEFVFDLAARLGTSMQIYTGGAGPVGHTLFRTAEVAASAGTVLGWGRPELPGWTDVRVFQYPGAGGVLLHDDADEWLEPGVHYLTVERGSVESVVEALERLQRDPALGPRIRRQAFRYVQARHSSVVRVRAALTAVGLRA